MVRFYTLFRREVLRFVRVIGQTILTPMITATLYLAIFGVSMGQHLRISEEIAPQIIVTPAIMKANRMVRFQV